MNTPDSTPETPAGDETPDESTEDAATEEATERRPYIVVLMSAEMKEAVKKYADDNDTNPTALARKLLAEAVGYPLEDEPTTSRRAKYTSDEERDAAHKVASKLSGLKRKALFQVHTAQLKSRKELLAVSNRIVIDLFDKSKKFTAADLEAFDKELDTAIKAGK